MLHRSAVYDWLDASLHGYPDQYARARTQQAETMLAELLETADNGSQDTISGESGPRPDTEWISRSKLRVDTRKWAMNRLAPKKYKEKLDVTSGDQPITRLNVTIRRAGEEPVDRNLVVMHLISTYCLNYTSKRQSATAIENILIKVPFPTKRPRLFVD